MKKNALILLFALSLSTALGVEEPLEKQFQNPPVESKASAYWWWLNALADKEAITRHMEEFHDKGISSVLLVNSSQFCGHIAEKGPEFLSPGWMELFRHSLQEAERLGISIDVNMAPGWNNGGKWITPDKACRWYLQSEATLQGPQKFSGKLPPPGVNEGYDSPPTGSVRFQLSVPFEKANYRDTAVVAFRTPEGGKPQPRPDLPAKSNRRDGNTFQSVQSVMSQTLGNWPSSAEDRPVKPSEVVDLTSKLKPDGTLEWDVPEGEWTIVRTGHRMTGAQLSVPLPGCAGLENDFLDRAGIEVMFNEVGKQMFDQAGPHVGKSFRGVAEDSFEAGYPNWTSNLLERFKKYRGYDPAPYLPVLKGWIVGSAEVSDRFLHDYRKTVADCFADEHFGRMTELARERGMITRCESAGPSWSGTVCFDALKNLGRVDIPQGEFWRFGFFVEGDQNTHCKQTATAAHVYGKKLAAAEALTAVGKDWRFLNDSPSVFKPVIDRAFCEGINQMVFQTSVCHREQDGLPGIEYNAGTQFNPNMTWWQQSAGPFLDYINRSQALLQSGLFAADVLYYNGDWAPNLVPPKHTPAGLGKGYDYDVCNEEVLLKRLSVKDGKIVLPDGMSYCVLVLPDSTKMPAPVAQKLRELVQAGATVIGPKPLTDPGLKNHPQCDEVVKQIGEELWGGKTGKGRVFADKTEREVLLADGVLPDFEAKGANDTFIDFIHRTTPEAEIYFLANRKDRPEKVTANFRQTGRQPELWDPMTGEQRDLPQFTSANGTTTVPLEFEPHGSMFVVFRKPAAEAGKGSNFPALETVQTLEGPWTVQFDKDWFYPATNNTVVFDKLEDWTLRPEDAVKHFSGTALYRKSFAYAPSQIQNPKSQIFLDLGTVGHSAKVRLNGKDLGVAWCKPWRVEITDALKPGENELEIEVVNSWPNRLIGDTKLPKEQRRTRTNINHYDNPANQTLVPSGLLGPVSILAEIKPTEP